MKKRIAILGSTGSIGTQTLDVIRQQSAHFEVEILTANNNAELLIKQAKEFVPNAVVIANKAKYSFVSEALNKLPIKVFAGSEAIGDVVEFQSVDIVLTAMVGFAGLLPTIRAIEAGKPIALANKETLVVAGDIITHLAMKHRVGIYPVDSEHSAIFQCLVGEQSPIEKIYLTASGGPFRGKNIDFLKKVTKKQALKHPNWDMGAKITIDSASLMNKGLEVIEAKWLFGLKQSQIDVIVHPQSIVHSIVQFQDGSMKAQMGLPDMKLPIQFALGFPERLKADFPRFSFLDFPQLSFEQPDYQNFRNLNLAFEALKTGGNMPCILNAANEVAVQAFLEEKIAFLEMPMLIEKTMQKATFIKQASVNEYLSSDTESREIARSFLK